MIFVMGAHINTSLWTKWDVSVPIDRNTITCLFCTLVYIYNTNIGHICREIDTLSDHRLILY